MRQYSFLVIFMLISVCSFAQKAKEDTLVKKIRTTKDLKLKLDYYSELVWHYRSVSPAKADSLEQEIIDFAEESGDPTVAELAWIYKVNRSLNNSPSKQTIAEHKRLAEAHLKKAKNLGLKEMQSLWLISLANCAIKLLDKDDVIKYANEALTIAQEKQVDTLTIYAHQLLAMGFDLKDDKISQFRQINLAVRIAEKNENPTIKINGYYAILNFYRQLKKYDKAKEYALKVKDIAEKLGDFDKRMNIYQALGYIYGDDKQYSLANKYFNKMLHAADSAKTQAYRGSALVGLSSVLGSQNKYKEKYIFLTKQHPEILKEALNYGYENSYYSWIAASAMRAGMLNEAYENLQKIEADPNHRLNDYDKIGLNDMYAWYYDIKKEYPKAISYAEKSYAIANNLKDVAFTMSTTRTLDTLYLKTKNYAKAYQNRVIYQKMQDSLDVLKEGQELMSIEIDTENRREALVREQEEAEVRRRNNVQYLGITVGIVTIFILLIMLGVFNVSESTIKALGFFAFIFLFEFIIFLADVQIHHFTHGEPIKIMGIKIVLVAALVPVHHWLEHKVVHYLLSKDMIQKKDDFVAKWLRRKKKPVVE